MGSTCCKCIFFEGENDLQISRNGSDYNSNNNVKGILKDPSPRNKHNKNINNNIDNNFSNFISNNNNNQIYNENKSLDNKIIKENNYNAPPKAEIEQKENEITPDDENKDNNLRQSEFHVNQDNVNNINNINNNINGSKDFPIINNDNELISSANEEIKNPTELKDENNPNENENENADTNNFVQKQDNNIDENNENNDVKIQYNGKSKNVDINVQPEDENKPNDFDNNVDYQIIP